jgi:GTP-binding protein
MIIRSASFVRSSPSLKQCPPAREPEFGFIGRSNVGKSSLINMLTEWSKLAKISSNPGKTRTINHFLINESWYLVDLPGYGYARVPLSLREAWQKSVREYILKRETLICLFVLIDSRHEPLKPDLEFLEFLGINQIPVARVFTKADKVSENEVRKVVRLFDEEMLKKWESVPKTFITSAVSRKGKDEMLSFIEETINIFSTRP